MKIENTPNLYSALTVVFSISFLFSCSFSNESTSEMLHDARDTKYDIIIVPGVPFEEENGKWSKVMKARVYWSKYLYETGITKNIIYSGSAVYSPYYEAEIMALYAEALGINKENVFAETKAEHSTENVYYSYKKAKQLGFKKIALATDPFQSKMLENFIEEKMHGKVAILPIVYDTLWAIGDDMIDPEIDYKKAYKVGFVSIVEREGFWKRFEGTLGKNIDTLAYE